MVKELNLYASAAVRICFSGGPLQNLFQFKIQVIAGNQIIYGSVDFDIRINIAESPVVYMAENNVADGVFVYDL